MGATKDSTGEPSSPNPIQAVAESVRKNIQKTYMFFGIDYPKSVDHIF